MTSRRVRKKKEGRIHYDNQAAFHFSGTLLRLVSPDLYILIGCVLITARMCTHTHTLDSIKLITTFIPNHTYVIYVYR